MLRLAVFVLVLLGALPACAEAYLKEELRLPMAGTQGLETLLVRPSGAGRYPLVVISHGSPRDAANAATMTPWRYYPQAMEFARRGFAAAIVMRRGYGGTGGAMPERVNVCRDADYARSGETSAQDLVAAIAALKRRDDIDGREIVAVGQSAGGLATVALAADPPSGLVAAISFAGGRGSTGDFEVCHEDRLIEAFRHFGTTSRLPMLWIYSENDRYFPPPMAAAFRQAFAGAGGVVQFINAPPFGSDGHDLFSLAGIPTWAPMVDAFLTQHKLMRRDAPAPLDLPALTPPAQLSERGREAFGRYLMAGEHKAFAVSSDGRFGWRTGRRSVEDAKEQALKLCGGADCEIAFIDDAPAR